MNYKTFSYIGTELDLFEQAHNWKMYYSKFLRLHLQGRVLEVGAGIGGSTVFLCDGSQSEWLCLEPDADLHQQIQKKIVQHILPPCCVSKNCTLRDISDDERFDAILYIDVLEHIENDSDELQRAFAHLKTHGRLIVLAPAYQTLFSEFDEAVGHFRRYTKNSLIAAAASLPLHLVDVMYLDSVALLLSLGNKLLLNQSRPTYAQIHFWDKVIVPISCVADKVFRYSFGRSVIGIWKKV